MSSAFALGITPDGASPLLQVVPFVLILGIFYFIILLPARRKQQKVQEFLAGLKVNDKVVMTNGIYGQITRLGNWRLPGTAAGSGRQRVIAGREPAGS